jgi:simple sugar transport system ATP-binding protein
MSTAPLIELIDIKKQFGPVIALNGVSVSVMPGECHCLLGDNGAGKSTFIKTMAGVHKPTSGEIRMGGKKVEFANPRDAMTAGVATVYQDLAMIPLMSVTRNFWMGREPRKGWGPFRFLDMDQSNQVTLEEMRRMGISLREPDQAVGTLSGGERQTVAIARAVYFGAKVLILDEPTCARLPMSLPPLIACERPALALSSSPTTFVMPWPWGTALPSSIAARHWGLR